MLAGLIQDRCPLHFQVRDVQAGDTGLQLKVPQHIIEIPQADHGRIEDIRNDQLVDDSRLDISAQLLFSAVADQDIRSMGSPGRRCPQP